MVPLMIPDASRTRRKGIASSDLSAVSPSASLYPSVSFPMVRWQDCHNIRKKVSSIMTRQQEQLIRRRSSAESGVCCSCKSDSTTTTTTTATPPPSPTSPPVLQPDTDPPLEPFTHFDISDNADDLSNECSFPDPAGIGRSQSTSPRPMSPSSCQLERMRNPICISSKSVKEIYPKLASVSPPYLLLESLIYLMCRMHASDEDESGSLFTDVCGELERCGFLASSYRIDPSHKVHQVFASTFSNLILDLRRDQKHPPPGAAVIDSRHHRLLNNFTISDFIEQSRYRRSFGKKTLIAKGGFGTVFRARHSLDEMDYAVKVIRFRVRSVDDYVRILREVQLYANLPAHANVVTYKTAWMESDFDARIFHEHGHGRRTTAAPVKIEELVSDQSSGSTAQSPGQSDEETSSSCQVAEVKKTSEGGKSSSSGSSVVFEASTDSMIHQNKEKQNGDMGSNRSCKSDPSNGLNCREHELESSLLLFTGTEPILATNGVSHVRGYEQRTRSGSISDSAIDYGIIKMDTDSPAVREYPASPVSSELLVNGPDRRLVDKISVTLYIQMELCGINLKTWITRRNKKITSAILAPNAYSNCMSIFSNILMGVSFLHDHHLIHRDLKPQNILFDVGEAVVKIGDFGLATLHQDDVHVVEHSPIKSYSFSPNGHTIGMGTTLYTAPEQRSSCRYDVKADMYSLGIILFELLHPFQTMMEKEKCITDLKTRSLLPLEFMAHFPAASRVIQDLTSVDPDRRPSAADVLANSQLFPSKDQMITDLQAQIRQLQAENLLLKQQLVMRKSDL